MYPIPKLNDDVKTVNVPISEMKSSKSIMLIYTQISIILHSLFDYVKTSQTYFKVFLQECLKTEYIYPEV